jgi:protein TonB
MERRMFETSVVPARAQRAFTFPASLTIHGLVIVAALVVPLMGAHDLPEVAASGLRVILVEPQAPPAPTPPPARVRGVRSASAASRPAPQPGHFVAPARIPDAVLKDDLAELLGPVGFGPEGGVEGGDWDQPVITGVFNEVAEPQPVRIAEWQAPSKRRHMDPIYPLLARKASIQGVAVIECVITPQGRVANATVVEAPPLLGEAAREAVLQWEYTPMIQNGVPIPVLLRVRVTFTLARS